MSLMQEIELAKQQAQRKHEINKKIELAKQQVEQEYDSKQLKILLDNAFETHKDKIIDCAKLGKRSYRFSILVDDNYFKNPINIENEAKLYCLTLGFDNPEVQYRTFGKNPNSLISSNISFIFCMMSSLFWISASWILYVETGYLFYIFSTIFVALMSLLIFWFDFKPSLTINVYF